MTKEGCEKMLSTKNYDSPMAVAKLFLQQQLLNNKINKQAAQPIAL
jgi:hypothetical protein